MAGLWQKTLYYLGLVDDEDGAEPSASAAAPDVAAAAPPAPSPAPRSTGVRHVGAPTAVIPGERVEPPPRSRRRISAEPSLAEAGVYVEYGDAEHNPTRPAGGGETEIIVANAFSDAQLLADLIRDKTPVVLDLRGTEPEMVRRLVDFASGLTYALDGTMRKVAQGVILVTPPRVTVSRDERRRLAEYGLYQATDAG
jgi:FtsZ-interacting cell division protein YlmF